MTLQIEQLMEFIASDFFRGLAPLRASTLMAEDLGDVAKANRGGLRIDERNKIDALALRVRTVSAEANHGADTPTEVVKRYDRPPESLTAPAKGHVLDQRRPVIGACKLGMGSNKRDSIRRHCLAIWLTIC